MAIKFHRLEVASISKEGRDARAIGFEIKEELRELFEFKPGQYLTLEAEIDGKQVRRSYSICSSANEEFLRIGIKKIEGGVFSTFAQEFEIGDMIDVMAPQGRFVAEVGQIKRPLLIAAGSGITPILSIAKSLLALDDDAEVTLIYGNRTTDEIMFREEIEALKDGYMERFSLFHILSREAQDVDLNNGRINGEKLKTMIDNGVINLKGYDGVYLCGPHGMVEECTRLLIELGVDESNVHTELFTPADGGKPDENRLRVIEKQAQGDVEVVTIVDGTSRDFSMNGKSENVLEAAQRAGIDLPFSCAGGMCCTCRCRIAEGSGQMEVNYSLEPWEIEAGFTLACQTRPTSKRLILDFDAV